MGDWDWDRPPRTLLKQLIQARRQSLEEFCADAERFARKHGEVGTLSPRHAQRLAVGHRDGQRLGPPRPATRRLLERMLNRPLEQLLGPPDVGSSDGSLVAGRGTPPVMTVTAPKETRERKAIMDAARGSAEHSIQVGGVLDDSALEQLNDEVRRLVRSYDRGTPPLLMLSDLVRARDTVYALLECTEKPRQASELYLLAGQLCGMLALTSLDLGHPRAAEQHARAAWAYGQIIEHNSLRTWARATQAVIAFWSGQPRRGVELVRSALPVAPPGTPTLRLHIVEARALSMLGAVEPTQAALRAADEAAELDVYDELQDGTGGELGFPAARKALSIGTAYVGLGMGEDAEPAAGQALELYLAADPEDRAVGGIAGARIDLATARLLKSRPDLAGAADALNPVMELPAEQRAQRLTQRLNVLSGLLAQPRLRDATEARTIGQQIEAFSALSASHGPAALTLDG